MRIKIIVKMMVLAMACLYSQYAYGQRKPPSNTINLGWGIEPAGCEINNIILEQAHQEARDTIIILIARPGLKDKRKI